MASPTRHIFLLCIVQGSHMTSPTRHIYSVVYCTRQPYAIADTTHLCCCVLYKAAIWHRRHDTFIQLCIVQGSHIPSPTRHIYYVVYCTRQPYDIAVIADTTHLFCCVLYKVAICHRRHRRHDTFIQLRIVQGSHMASPTRHINSVVYFTRQPFGIADTTHLFRCVLYKVAIWHRRHVTFSGWS